MKKMTYFVMALAMVLGFTQCKKEQIEPQNEGNSVMITLNVGGGDNNGSKAVVTPPSVTFETGDEILVASDGHYVGTLTYNGTNFSGDITNPVVGEPLYFYFLGNNAVLGEANGNGDITSCTVNVSDQTNYPHLPVISMGVSIDRSNHNAIVEYSSEVTSYEAQLHNKASLIKFKVTTPSDAAICITGMNNMVTVKFNDRSDNDGFSYGMDGEGVIMMNAVTSENTETWAVVLPQAVVGEGVASTEYDGYTYIGTRPAIAGGIAANQYLDAGINMAVDFNQYLTPLTFEAKTAGATVYITVSNGDLDFSTNGIDWEPYTSGEQKRLSSVGDKISFRGNCTRVGIFQCNSGNQCYIYGNVMSLVNKTDYATTTSLPSERIFQQLFWNNKAIYNHPLKTLALPATTLQNYCYNEMFSGCTNLTKAPELPATTLQNNCYQGMFLGCTSLTAAPELPAMILAESCYSQMFSGCTSLTAAPELPAPTLVYKCYYEMFNNCSSLQSVTCLATPNSSCTYNWMGGSVPWGSSHTFTKKRGTNWESGSNGIQRYWTVVEVD